MCNGACMSFYPDELTSEILKSGNQGMICATVLVCHFTPQEQCVKVAIDERQAKNN